MPRLDAVGRVVRWYCSTENVDDRRKAEAALHRLAGTLEARVADEVAAHQAVHAKLQQAQRMEALGQLASGVAHDFNNVLQAVQSGLEMIVRRPDDVARVERIASLAGDAAARGAAITGRLLSLARHGTLKSGPLYPAELLEDMADLLARLLGATVEIRVEAADGLPPLMADRAQLETVLINLATNARDAMPGGGLLTFSAMVVADPEHLAPGAYVAIAAADTGEGMDEATLARVSEPFFTTKAVGQGTGLGLAMARGFAEQSGGALHVSSVPGVGTTVRLFLPVANPRAPEDGALDDGALAGIGRAGVGLADMAEPCGAVATPERPGPLVLLVEDDPAVRTIMAEQLEEFGYGVLAAPDAAVGLALLAAHPDVAVLVSDLTMPGLDGVALIRAAQRIRPGLPAILVTGYPGAGVPLSPGWPRRVVQGRACCSA